MSLKTNIKNGLLTGGKIAPSPSNQPTEYEGRQTRYFERRTTAFIRERAKYSADYFDADVQGADNENPFAWAKVRMRLADIVRPSAAITRRFEDYKMTLIAEPPIDYLRPGAKIKAMGSTWLAINPSNISNTIGNGIIQRCNAVWNYLDYYGNIMSEPIAVQNLRANASDSDDQTAILITKGYFNLVMQYNEATAQLDTNSRLILGTAAYRITGYSDFHQEFTGDYDTVRLLSFDARYEEPNDEIDDMANHVAGGKAFSWAVGISGPPSLKIGSAALYTPHSERNGEDIVSTDEHPVSYLWQSSDESVFTVDSNGEVTAVSEGSATLICVLEQNPNVTATLGISVVGVDVTPHIEFISTVPETLNAYDSVAITAAYFEGGAQTAKIIDWTVEGADEGSFSWESGKTGPNATYPSQTLYPGAATYPNPINVTGNTITIYAWSGSATPLTVTASYGEVTESVKIVLLGI